VSTRDGRFTVTERLTSGVVLRGWQHEDASELALQANDRDVWLNLRDAFPHPYTLADAHRFIELSLTKSPPSFLAIQVDGDLAGGIGYTLHSDVERVGAEIGYWLGRRYWGRGFGTTAVRALTDLAFEAHPDLRRLYAVPFSSNPASARLLQKAGYILEGTLRQSAIKDGRVLDQWMYAIVREEWSRRRGEGG
jgi:RimJ/RimL family protein N-acetyltransferase